ncbi:MAG: GIY-YIG nuclease family protein [Ignavibacterium sp.]
MYFVYVLWSNKLKKRYIGSSEDVTERLTEHNTGKSTFTKRGMPWILIHKEDYKTKAEALKREKFLKTGVGRGWLDKQYPQYKHS